MSFALFNVAVDGPTVALLLEKAALVAVIGAAIGLDNIAVGQFMIAQPVIGAVLVGAVLGEPLLGLWSALTFQFLWAGQLPVGAYVPPNAAVTAITAVGIAASSEGPLPTRALLAAGLAIPVGVVAGRLDMWVKTRNIRVLHRAEDGLLDNERGALGAAVWRGTANFFFKDLALIFVAVALGSYILGRAAAFYTAYFERVMSAAFIISPVVGIASALKMYWRRRNLAAFAGGLALAAAVTWLVRRIA